MLDAFFESKFHAKCKSYIKFMKTRLVTIKKKRNAVEKYLKNDVAELLRSGLYYNAYGKAEALLVEQNITPCYYLIEQFCDCISNHLLEMDKQRECPEECREAVASLIYAAARFSDLPELRALRSLFTRKYGSSIESHVNKDFHGKLRTRPLTKDMKLQLMQDIAHENSIDWDSKALEQQLFCLSPPSGHNHQQLLSKEYEKDATCGLSNLSAQFKSERNDVYSRHSSSEDEVATISTSSSRNSTDLDGLKSSSSIASISEDDLESKRQSPYRLIDPPYIKPNNRKYNNNVKEGIERSSCADEKENQQNESATESHPKTISVRRPFKTQPHHGDVRSGEKAGRHASQSIHADVNNQMDEDGRMYSKKRSPFVDKEKGVEQCSLHEHVDEISHTGRRNRHARGLSLPPQPTSPKMPTGIHTRATSLQPDMLARHVHPKLPDYDELTARFSALRGKK